MITLKDVQRRVGVEADGLIGPATIAAIAKALGIEEAKRSLSNPAAFFDAVRVITRGLDQTQVDTINGLLTSASHWPTSWLAYGLATAWHEARFRPIEEYGKGTSRKYGVPGKYGQAQYGRGLVQLTWDVNYERADRELAEAGIIKPGELLANFSLALRPDIAAFILVKGMEEGWFTNRSLGDFLGSDRGTKPQFVQCRTIINGTDRADMIAELAMHFQGATDVGGWA